MKCNNDARIVETLANAGTGFDCASPAEIDLVLGAGAKPHDIVYAHPIKPVPHLQQASASGVHYTVVDSMAELDKLAAYAPNARVLLRLAVDDEGSMCQFSAKFGAHEATVPDLLRHAAKLGVDIVGISYHVGSGCYTIATYENALEMARRVFDVAYSQGQPLWMLDMGGGFPGCSKGMWEPALEGRTTFPEIARAISTKLDQLFPADSVSAEAGTPLRVIAEPGRYFVQDVAVLGTRVEGVRRASENGVAGVGVGGQDRVYLSDGVYGALNNVVHDHAQPNPMPISTAVQMAGPMAIDAALRLGIPKDGVVPCSVWGPTCDSVDKIDGDAYLPRLDPGSWMIFAASGAYTHVAGSQFNGFGAMDRTYVEAHEAWDVEVTPELQPELQTVVESAMYMEEYR